MTEQTEGHKAKDWHLWAIAAAICAVILATLLSLLLVPASPSPGPTPTPTATLTPLPPNTVFIDAPAEAREDSDFTARVSISGVSLFDNGLYDVTYDPAIIEVTDVTDGLISGTAIHVLIWDYIPIGEGEQGTVRVLHNLDGPYGTSGSGYLAEIHFHVVGSAGDISPIAFSNGELTDCRPSEIQAAWINGSVLIVP